MSALEKCSVQQAAERLQKGWLYLDVRTPEEFEEGHPEGAYNVPWQLRAPSQGLIDNPDFLPHTRALLPADAALLVGCRSGARAAAAARALSAHFARICLVEGGMDGARDAFGALLIPGWRQAQLPLHYDLQRSYRALLAGSLR